MNNSLSPLGSNSLNEFVNNFFNNRLWPSVDDASLSLRAGAFPRVDISEDKKSLIVKADIPGIDSDKVEIDIHDGVLTLSGSVDSETQDTDEDRKYYRYERTSGSFSRSFVLPTAVDEDAVTATAKNGVITITLPKTSVKDKKKITIQSD